MFVEPTIETLSEYEDSYYGTNHKGVNLSNEMKFWLTLYGDETNPHFLRTEHLKNLIPSWDWEIWEKEKPWCFNDFCNMFKYTYDDLGELKLLDQKLFKYYYRKIRDFRNAGGVLDESNELYIDFCNYFEVML